MDSTDRLAKLEGQVRLLRTGLALTFVTFLALGTLALNSAQQQTDVIRARGLIITDSAGRERILVGAPIPEQRGRIEPGTGLAIRDTTGAERFGLTLMPSGQMGMGFDAPRGTGDDRNRERINIVADRAGGANIRFLNRKTGVAGYIVLGSDDNMYVQFQAQKGDSSIWRQIGAVGDTIVVRPR